MTDITRARPQGRAAFDDLLSPEAVDDSFRFFAKLRDHAPVYWNQRWNGWIVTGYKDVSDGFRNWEQLSSDRFEGPFGEELSAAESTYPSLLTFLKTFFVWKDPPYHTRVRKLVSKAFTPRSVEVLRPSVRALVDSLVGGLEGPPEVDFFSKFAFTLPVIVIADYLGVPQEAREDVRAWSEDLASVIFVRGNDDDRLQRGERAMQGLVDFLRPVVRARRTDPRDDLISGMVQAEERGDFLSEDEVIGNVILMVFAGHETTMNLLANGMVAFQEFPEQWGRLRSDLSLAKTATDEVLRYDGPIKSQARWAREAMNLGGRPIEAGDRVLLVQTAANHDPDAFEDPDRLDIGRRPNRHTAFGYGMHSCLGAPLARLEAEEAFKALATAFPSFRIGEEELHHHPTVVSRSLTQLHIAFSET
jgi:cytochrome P450